MSISGSSDTSKPSTVDTFGRGRPHQAVLAHRYDEPEQTTPCFYDPERWHPDEQRPDPSAMAACWSCFFQSRCALKALNTEAEFGIWAGYRLAPGPGLERTRKQLAIIAGLEYGPAVSPGAETDAVLAGGITAVPNSDEDDAPEGQPAVADLDIDALADPDELDTGTVIELADLPRRSTTPRQCAAGANQLALFTPRLAAAHAG